MILKDMIALVRQRAKDKDPVKPLWSNADITQALNESQWQACRRARLIKDSTTDDTCRIDLDASGLAAVDPRVMFIRRVKLNSTTLPLKRKRWRDMDAEVPGWEGHTGNVVAWVPDYTTGKLRFYRMPTVLPDFVMLTVVRGPLEDLEGPDDEPEIHPRFHYKLHHHALSILFSDQDAETYDPDMAAKHAAAFTEEFGPPSSAAEEQWIEENFDFEDEQGVF